MMPVIAELERLRSQSRTLLVLQRAAAVAAAALSVCLGLMAVDFLLRLPSAVRLILLIAGVAALCYVCFTYLRAAIRFSPTLTELALRVERSLPRVTNRLASSVEFSLAGIDKSNPLASRSIRETDSRLAGESVRAIIDPSRTWKVLAGLLGVLAIVVALFMVNPSAATTGFTRLFAPYAPAKWPARTGVESRMGDTLAAPGVHPRGQTLLLRAVSTKAPDDRVDAWYRLRVDGRFEPWRRIVLTHQGGGVHERLIDTTAEELEVYFETSDDRTETEEIQLVLPPAVMRATLTVVPPDYARGHRGVEDMELGPGTDDRAATDVVSLIGSTAQLSLSLNKQLPVPGRADAGFENWLQATLGWGEGLLPEFAIEQTDQSQWRLTWQIAQSRRLTLQLVDEYGLRNAEHISYEIEAIEDYPPSVTVTEPQADQAVLRTAVIPVTSTAQDDVAVTVVGLEARIDRTTAQRESDNSPPDADEQDAPAHWEQSESVDDPVALLDRELTLTEFELADGQIVEIRGFAEDLFEVDGQQHDRVYSSPRRLRIISELDFSTHLRRQLSAVRQHAIRIETLQAELQEDVADAGVQPGIQRAQAQLAERIAAQRESVEAVVRELEMNRLEDEQLTELLQQSQDLLDFAGQAASNAVQAIEQRESQSQPPGAVSDAERTDESPAESTEAGPQGSGQMQADREGSQQGEQAESDAGDEDRDADDDARDEQAPEIVDAQQEVRDELVDLIELLDRDEDTWVITRKLEGLIQQQQELQERTQQLGQQTIGQSLEDLTAEQRTELERIAEQQTDLRDDARSLIEEARERAEALEDIDPESAEGIRQAAETAERQELDREMEQAADRVNQNQMQSAASAQQSAASTLQQMLGDMEETKRARAQELLRRLASLQQSIERLIVVQENELSSLAVAVAESEFTGRDREMIRLRQNTQSVAVEARSAGQQTRRIGRTLDRAADAQGAAVAALRATPIEAENANEAEERALELLKTAKEMADELEQATRAQETQRQREELRSQYQAFAEQELAIRTESLKLVDVEQLDRRQLLDARQQAAQQQQVRIGLDDLRKSNQELMESIVFRHVHDLIDSRAQAVEEALRAGPVTIDVTDNELFIAQSIGRLIEALEEGQPEQDEFANNQEASGGSQGQGQQGQDQLIPPIAQLKLIKGLEEHIYSQTQDLDIRPDLDEAQRRNRIRDLGQQQRDLMRVAEEMLEALQQEAAQRQDQ